MWIRSPNGGSEAVWRPGDLQVKTHMEQLAFLVYGSSTLRFVLDLVQKVCLSTRSDKRHHKLLLGEALPVCAWYAEVVLQFAYVGVAAMHAGLTSSERSQLAQEFNDPKSDLIVLILLADVSIVGLNLHVSCSTVFIMSILRNLASEIQLWGRVIRVSHVPPRYF